MNKRTLQFAAAIYVFAAAMLLGDTKIALLCGLLPALALSLTTSQDPQ